MIIPVLVGPTCIGKTSLALQLAKETGCDILSIDSRQVFKFLDIGTGKYKEQGSLEKFSGYWEIDGVKIWGYDVFNPDEELNVLKYCEFAKKVIEYYRDSSKKLIATCGTGFYLDFLAGRITFSEINQARKNELQLKDLSELRETLTKLAPDTKVDWENKFRLVTKILTLESKQIPKNFEIKSVVFKKLYLTGSRNTLFENADNFTEFIFQSGVIEEYQNALKEYGSSRALQGLIYKNIGEYLAGKILFDDLKSQIKFSLHAYIRRQQTYFKKMEFYFTSESRKDIAEKIKELL